MQTEFDSMRQIRRFLHANALKLPLCGQLSVCHSIDCHLNLPGRIERKWQYFFMAFASACACVNSTAFSLIQNRSNESKKMIMLLLLLLLLLLPLLPPLSPLLSNWIEAIKMISENIESQSDFFSFYTQKIYIFFFSLLFDLIWFKI